jgi:uncharacterized protein
MITQEFSDIATKVKEFLENESSGHDFYHAERVFNNAIYLQEHEGGDLFVIGAAALIHDVCRPWEKKTGKSHFGEEALKIIEDILHQVNINENKIQQILEVIKLHDIYDWTEKMKDKSVELQIVQDADNLDAIGAIGIGRTFAFGGAHNLQMYCPGENLNFTKDFVEDTKYQTSTIGHFYEKLLRLKDNMNTETGKKIAQIRHQVMEDFLKQFFDEWNGNFNLG